MALPDAKTVNYQMIKIMKFVEATCSNKINSIISKSRPINDIYLFSRHIRHIYDLQLIICFMLRIFGTEMLLNLPDGQVECFIAVCITVIEVTQVSGCLNLTIIV
jgi:hypothetical protein